MTGTGLMSSPTRLLQKLLVPHLLTSNMVSSAQLICLSAAQRWQALQLQTSRALKSGPFSGQDLTSFNQTPDDP